MTTIDTQRRIAQALLSTWNSTKQPLKQRGLFPNESLGDLPENPVGAAAMGLFSLPRLANALAPVGIYEDGSYGPAVPAVVQAGIDGVKNFGRYGYGEDAVADNAINAFDAAGLAMTGSLATGLSGGMMDNAVNPVSRSLGGMRDQAIAKYLDWKHPPEQPNVVPFGQFADPFANAGIPENFFARRPGNDPTEANAGFKNFADIIPRKDGASVTATKIYGDYVEWAEKNNMQALPYQQFMREMADQGFTNSTMAGRQRFIGLDGFPEDAFFANAKPSAAVPLAAQAAESQTPKGITAYHGSPHDFDRFSLDRIGTGEGAQAYGHGLYFAEAEDVARGYRETLSMGNSPDNYAAMDQAKEALEFAKGDKQAALKRIDDIFADSPRDRKHAELSKKYVMEPPGRMYEVNIRANPEDFLDWDKPLSQQSETVRKAVLPLAEAQAQRYAQEDAYAAAKAQAMGMNLSPAPRQPVDLSAMHGSEIAKMTGLREAGIPGIRYLDGMSRRAGEGSSNYVVFDDSLIDILRKYANAPTASALPLAAETQDQDPALLEFLRSYGIK